MNLGVSKDEAKTLMFWILIVAIGMLIFVFIKINVYDPIVENQKYENAEYSVVRDKNEYYTAVTPIYHMYSFISYEQIDDLFKLLNEDYIKENEITKENIKEKEIFSLGIGVNFQNKRMCAKEFAPNLTSYIVEGDDVTLPPEVGEGKSEYITTRYYDIVLDSSNHTFNITPISKETYERGCSSGRKV